MYTRDPQVYNLVNKYILFSGGGTRVYGRHTERDGAGRPERATRLLRQEPRLLQGKFTHRTEL